MGCDGCSFKNIVSGDEKHHYISDVKSNSCNKLNVYDWLKDLPDTPNISNIVEVRFKNTRKEYFRNHNALRLKDGDLVSVEGTPGYDVGAVSLRGRLAELQAKRKLGNMDVNSMKTIFRKANAHDTNNWKEAKALEDPTMLKAREIAISMDLDMKIGDVEYQGDKTKAIFYYISETRVDFRELIKILASEFKVKIEMKQIGARQEAGRIGGIGSCGRELCCSTWRSELPSVKANAAQKQNLSPNAEKLMGQCGKLKCCLMYELDTYLEASEEFPKELLELETKHGIAYPHKIDVLKKTILYTYQLKPLSPLVEVPLQTVKDIIMLNKKGEKADKLESLSVVKKEEVN